MERTPHPTPSWEPPLVGSQTAQLLGALDRQRATFRWKADGRGRAGLSLAVGASTLTLGGLLAHLAVVEEHLAGLLDGVHVEQDDREWSQAAEEEPQVLYDRYDATVARVRERWAAALAERGPEAQVTRGSEQMSLRRVLLDLLEEYARHTGHADLLSEAVDGRVGEDPPEGWEPVGAIDDGVAGDPVVPVFSRRRMIGARFEMVDLSGADLHHVDLDGARFRAVNLRRVEMSGSDLVDVRIDAGGLERVVVNEVDVVPLVQAELDRRDPDRVLMRPTTAAGFRGGWDLVQERWAGTLERAGRLDPTLLHTGVGGEWSFVQTLRHLVFVEQAWVLRGVLGEPDPWHPLALPWDEAPPMAGVTHDRDARPDLTEVLALHERTRERVTAVLADLTDDELDEERTAPDDRSWPRGTHTVGECLLVTLNEEHQHRRFAERDLEELEVGG